MELLDDRPEALLRNTSEDKLQVWLTDEKARDQFVLLIDVGIEVYWNSMGNTKPELVDNLGVMTESFVQWSPQGTYLATIHSPGVSIWGGASFFSPLMRYHHRQVRLIDFSPREKYLLSYSRHDKYILKIFDVKTGELKISFHGSEHEFVSDVIGGVSDVSWPIRWSGVNDDRYFAKIEEKFLYIYDSKTFTIIDNECIKLENVLDFSWSPADPILALVAANDNGSQPARVSLVNIPGKVELMQKNLINVSDCKLLWQTAGDYLAIILNRLSSTNTSKYTTFEFINIKEPGIPIDDLELDNKNDNIIAFAWEPKGHRFAVIHHDGASQRPDISFYAVCLTEDRGWVSKLITLKGMLADSLYWSPVGHFIIFAGLKDFSGQLNFYYVDSLETLSTHHFLAKHIEWSPSGRCLATSGYLSQDMRTGVKIWSFCGKLLYQIPRNAFHQFLWRPRPPSFMSMKTGEEVFEDLELSEVPTAFNFQGCNSTTKPEGWNTWLREFNRLGRLMLKNGKSTSSAGNQ